MSPGEAAATASAIVAAIGLFFVASQLYLNIEQAKTDFEEQLNAEYRMVLRDIPIQALLDEPLGNCADKSRNGIYNYVDLSNTQTFLWMTKRVRDQTWEQWRDGIKSNLLRKRFKEVWTEIRQSDPFNFNELRALEEVGFDCDRARLQQRVDEMNCQSHVNRARCEERT